MGGISVREHERTVEALPPQLALAWNTRDLDQIARPDKNILVSFWDPGSSFRELLAAARRAGELPEFRERHSRAGITEFFNREHGPLLDLLFTELRPSIDTVLNAGYGKHFQVTLARPTDQMCPLFHVDSVSLRLIVTLHGPGTEWLADADVNRKQLGKGSNHKVVREGALIQQLATFQVGLLKGEDYPGNHGKGLVHRSPPHAPTDEPRWIFRLDSFRR